MSQYPEASEVVLTPIDVSQLHAYGLRITRERIYTTKGEKRELLDRILREGQNITIEYIVDGIKANVVYRVSSLEPFPAYVGSGTTMIIEDETSSKTSPRKQGVYAREIRRCVRASMQERLRWFEAEIESCNMYGLDARNLILEANSLKEQLRDFW